MKTAIVTGASTGIGRAVALALAKESFHVFLIARRVDELEKTKKLIELDGGQATIFAADLSKIESVDELIQQIKSQTKTVDLIANVAGIWHGKDDVYAGTEYQQFDQQVILDTFNVGMVAPALIVHGLLPMMPAGSKVINLSGTFEDGGKGWLPYYVSKRALEDFTVGLSQELSQRDIQVNCISPSDTATDSYAKFFPEYIPDAVQPKEIAAKFVELSKPENKTTGEVFVIKKDMAAVTAFHY